MKRVRSYICTKKNLILCLDCILQSREDVKIEKSCYISVESGASSDNDESDDNDDDDAAWKRQVDETKDK